MTTISNNNQKAKNQALISRLLPLIITWMGSFRSPIVSMTQSIYLSSMIQKLPSLLRKHLHPLKWAGQITTHKIYWMYLLLQNKIPPLLSSTRASLSSLRPRETNWRHSEVYSLLLRTKPHLIPVLPNTICKLRCLAKPILSMKDFQLIRWVKVECTGEEVPLKSSISIHPVTISLLLCRLPQAEWACTHLFHQCNNNRSRWCSNQTWWTWTSTKEVTQPTIKVSDILIRA